MALDSTRLATAIIDAWYNSKDAQGNPNSGFNPAMSREEIEVFIRPQIEAIAKEVVKEFQTNAVVDGTKIK